MSAAAFDVASHGSSAPIPAGPTGRSDLIDLASAGDPLSCRRPLTALLLCERVPALRIPRTPVMLWQPADVTTWSRRVCLAEVAILYHEGAEEDDETGRAERGASFQGKMTADPETVPERQEAVWLGELIRSRRRGLSLDELARRSGVSSGLLSQIERGKGNPSYFTLLKLAQALDMEPTEFFRPSDGTGDDRVVRAASRQRMLFPDGHYTEILSPRSDVPTVMWKVVYPPGTDYRENPFLTVDEMAIVVIRGRILARIQGSRDICLDEGDAMRVKTGELYGACNPGDDDAELIGASSILPFSISHLSLSWAADA
jgi:transcriptional regulator with XRE-family HTH domain